MSGGPPSPNSLPIASKLLAGGAAAGGTDKVLNALAIQLQMLLRIQLLMLIKFRLRCYSNPCCRC